MNTFSAHPTKAAPVTTVLAALAAATALLMPAAASAGPEPTVPTTQIKPVQLPRGADDAAPRLENGRIVDGTIRIAFDHEGEVLGKYGDAYVVEVYQGVTAIRWVALVQPDGAVTVLASKLGPGRVHLSPSGTLLAVQRHTRVRIVSLAGDPVVTHEFPGRRLEVLDLGDSQVLVATQRPAGTRVWDFIDDRGRRIDARSAYFGSLARNRLAFYTGDPYPDGCSVLTALSAPATPIWRSCRERVHAISTDGSRLVTIHILSDGLGPNRAWVRSGGGRLLAHYVIDGWFGDLRWESGDALLLQSNGPTWAAQVRCTVTPDRVVACERASRLTRTVMP